MKITLLLLLSTYLSSFSQDTAKHRIDLKAQGWTIDTIPPYVQLYKVFYGKNGAPDTVRLDTNRVARPTNDSLFIPPYCNTAGVTLITYRPDTVRAKLLVTYTTRRWGVAHARDGFVVTKAGEVIAFFTDKMECFPPETELWKWREANKKIIKSRHARN